jgi:hypothetical protein
MKKLKNKNKKREAKLETARNKARLSYPVDVRIDLAMKNKESKISDEKHI